MKKHKIISKKHTATELGQTFTVRIPWKHQRNTWWNESCAMVIEVFGLPGDRYTSHPTMDYMDFYFKSPRDADMCKILLSERI